MRSPSGSLSTLALRRVPRESPSGPGLDARARYTPWLREPLDQLDFVINDRPLRDLLLEVPVTPQMVHGVAGADFLSVVDCAWPDDAASSLRQLAGTEPRDESSWPLDAGRLPLYVCPMCADLACGAVTVAVAWDASTDRVAWSDFRVEDGFSDRTDAVDLSALGPFLFDADAYRDTLLAPVGQLDALAADERAAATAYRQSRGVRGVLRRALRR